MSGEERDAVYRRCISTYGADAQIDMILEEMSELAKALLKNRRAKKHSQSRIDAIVDELADVKIMERQMELLFTCSDDVECRVDFKVQRQSKRLDELNE
ncbi:MAG: hypothetical protein LUG99_00325 [Lachnospiraceae bacterium]|nr:hypothetical protein [Lachnospiraceae bacterium]